MKELIGFTAIAVVIIATIFGFTYVLRGIMKKGVASAPKDLPNKSRQKYFIDWVLGFVLGFVIAGIISMLIGNIFEVHNDLITTLMDFTLAVIGAQWMTKKYRKS